MKMIVPVPRVRIADRPGARSILGAYLKIGAPATYLIVLVAASVLAPLPHNPLATNADSVFIAPNFEYWLGTDQNGADVLSRLVASARVDVVLAVVGALCSMLIGVPLGLLGSQRTRFAEYLM